ncbi:hypothetical protein EMIT0P291_280067 [Pseudomonas sp. IT-P291]
MFYPFVCYVHNRLEQKVVWTGSTYAYPIHTGGI